MGAALRRLDSVDEALGWLAARGVRRLVADSRRVRAGDAFLAWPGHGVDARRFVPQALAAGARACLVEVDGFEHAADHARHADDHDPESVAGFDGLKAATGAIADRFFGEPSRALDLLAVTGTNGKTSTAWWLAQSLSQLGRRCGVIGTLGIGEPPPVSDAASTLPIEPTGLTTPGPIELQAGLRRLVDAGFAACAVEATSIGLAEHRLAGTRIGIALFTNFTQDHLDYHGSMAAYWEAKAQLFAWPGLRAAVVNVDDARGAALAASLASGASTASGGVPDLWTCSTTGPARLRGSALRYLDGGGLAFEIEEIEEFDEIEATETSGERAAGRAPQRAQVATRIVGDFHLANLLVTIGGLRAAGVPLAQAVEACGRLTPVPGRMQQVDAPDVPLPVVVVDYAHTPDALDKALRALRPLAQQRGGALWCVFGCGGDRDAAKRPLMAGIAARLADRTVITSDNPRGESPEAILAAIAAGWPADASRAPEPFVDRRAAIAHAVDAAAVRDVVLVAGKGHESTQEIAGVRQAFSDLDESARALRHRAGVFA